MPTTITYCNRPVDAVDAIDVIEEISQADPSAWWSGGVPSTKTDRDRAGLIVRAHAKERSRFIIHPDGIEEPPMRGLVGRDPRRRATPPVATDAARAHNHCWERLAAMLALESGKLLGAGSYAIAQSRTLTR